MFRFYSSEKMLQIIEEHKLTRMSDVVLKCEQELTSRSEEEIFENMRKRLHIMKQAAIEGRDNPGLSKSGLSGGDAQKMADLKGKHMCISEVMRKATEYALGIMENNAKMGRIVAAPTAGSAGIVPGAILAMMETFNMDEDTGVRGLLAAAGAGIVIASIGTFSAAQAGCQAEIGASSSMAASAISEMRGMSPERCINASAIALKNMLGLACDPIGGLVEVPCVKRNAIGVCHAMTASDMSMAGLTSFVPFDQVVEAMNNVARNMHENIRETSRGGLAVSKKAKAHMAQLINIKGTEKL